MTGWEKRRTGRMPEKGLVCVLMLVRHTCETLSQQPRLVKFLAVFSVLVKLFAAAHPILHPSSGWW